MSTCPDEVQMTALAPLLSCCLPLPLLHSLLLLRLAPLLLQPLPLGLIHRSLTLLHYNRLFLDGSVLNNALLPLIQRHVLPAPLLQLLGANLRLLLLLH